MAENSSDSDSSITGWTVINQQDEYCASDSGSTSSSLEFVQLDDTAALYQRRSSERASHAVTDTTSSPGKSENEVTAPEVTSSVDRPENLHALETPLDVDPKTDTTLNPSPTDSESEMQQETVTFDPLPTDPVEDLDPDPEQTSPLVSPVEMVCDGGPDCGPSTSGQSVVDQNQQIEILHAALLRQESDSDSDFVKLDALQVDPGHEDHPGGERLLLEAAPHTPPTPSSSISAQFRFVNPAVVARLHEPNRLDDGGNENADDEEEDESLIGDFDDRCESDISGVATDDTDDSDLSGMLYSIGDVPLTAGRRLYRHRPNSDLNAILTVVSLLALFFAVGIAIGHYIGASRDVWLRKMQVEKMKGAQDNHLMCLKQADHLKERIHKLTAMYGHNGPCGGTLDGGKILRKTCGDIPQMAKIDHARVGSSERMASQTDSPTRATPTTPQEPPADPKTNQEAENQLKKYVVALRAELNQVEQENADLRGEVTRLRYTAHPANAHVDPHLTQQLLKVKVNQLTSENDDLKSAVGKMRYTIHPGNMHQLADEPVSVDVEASNVSDSVEIQMEVAHLERRLQNVSQELSAEKKMNTYLQGVVASTQKEYKSVRPAQPDSMLSCMKQRLPDVPKVVEQLLEGGPQEYLAKFGDAAKETTSQIVTKWKEVVQLLEINNIKLTTEVERLLRASWENGENENVTALDENNSVPMDVENTSHAEMVNTTGKPVTAHFQDYVNKTKLTMSKLSSTLQETWQKVKNLSNDFIINPEVTAKKVSNKIREKVNVVKEKVAAKWETVKQKVNPHGWNRSKKKAYKSHPQKEQGYPHKFEQKKPYQQQQQQHHGGQQRSNGGQQRSDTPQFKDTPKHFEDKPYHKQRQSSHEQYNEFWQKVEFDPDDFFQEGFFEGNQREWRKHQKRLKHLHGQMHRLNEDILYTMDDDDIEDIYDDFDDLEDDLEDEDQPQTLQMWLACQVRWWKSRLHRKHRSEDLIRGCGQQMMQWQLRALCKDRCVGKKCRKKGRGNLKEHPLCQQALHTENSRCLHRGQTSSPCHNDMTDKQGFHSNPSHQKAYVHVKNSRGYVQMKHNQGYAHVKDGKGYDHVKDGKGYDHVKDGKGYDHVKDGKGYAHVKDGKGYDHVKDGKGYDHVKDGKGSDHLKDSKQKIHPHAKPVRSVKTQKPLESHHVPRTTTFKDSNSQPPPLASRRRNQMPDEEALFTMEPAKISKDWQINDTVWTPEESEESSTGFQRTVGTEPAKADLKADNEASWVFERAVLREYHHHNPDWVFERAEERDMMRNKPWYVARSEQRQYRRLKQRQESRQP